MALTKKQKDAAYESFLADLKTVNPQIEELLKDEKVSTKLREGVLARADYSASMDELTANQQRFDQEVQEARQRIDGWKTWYGAASSEYATTKTKLQQYEDEFGELNQNQQRQVAKQYGLSVEQFEQRLSEEIQKRDVAALKFVDDLTDLKIEHRQRFGEKLDTAAVYKIAGEKQLPLDVAYQIYTVDKVKEETETKLNERIVKERADAVAEALSKHNLPVLSNNPDMVHVLDAPKDIPRASDDRIRAAVQGFMTKK